MPSAQWGFEVGEAGGSEGKAESAYPPRGTERATSYKGEGECSKEPHTSAHQLISGERWIVPAFPDGAFRGSTPSAFSVRSGL